MRRALVISILAHVLAIAGLFEFRPLPACSACGATGPVPLTVDFARFRALEEVGSGGRPDSSTVPVVAERHSGRRASAASSGGRRSSGTPVQAVRQPELQSPPSLAAAEGMAGLPPGLESEYRLNVARELRRAGSMSQAPDVPGWEGDVRLVISYWAGSHAPVVSLERSSGHAELDEMALAGLNAAVARVKLPGMAATGGFRVPFLVEYRRER